MVRRLFLALWFALPVISSAQFVYPRPEYHEHDPNAYKEDPFVVHYRHEFFSVFTGDFARFDKAFAEIQAMVKKNPKDARALVWLGNGETVKAGVLWMQGKKDESIALMKESRPLLDEAVSLKPDDPNIFMMRAVTLFVQGQNWPDSEIPKENWEKLRDDCAHLVRVMGAKLKKASVHVRGETFGEMGIADLKLDDKEAARAAFRTVIKLCPGTDYETRAKKELASLPANEENKIAWPQGTAVAVALVTTSGPPGIAQEGLHIVDVILQALSKKNIATIAFGSRGYDVMVPAGDRDAALAVINDLIAKKKVDASLVQVKDDSHLS